MYSKLPNMIYGFHGCHKDVFEKVICHGGQLDQSHNDYDWLGNGVYFWENNEERAEEWAAKRYGVVGRVIGAVLDLGNCLNLTDRHSTKLLKMAYEDLQQDYELVGKEMPRNKCTNESGDLLLRNLDCAIIQKVHELNGLAEEPPFDAVRGVFFEGPTIGNSEFREQTHIQIAVCNPNCIKGYFIPRKLDGNFQNP